MLLDLLKNPTINLKITILFLLSVFTILIFTGIGIYNNYKVYINTQYIEQYSKEAIKISSFIHQMQKERGLSAGYLGSNSKKFKSELQKQIEITDNYIQKFNRNIKNLAHIIPVLEINKIREKVANNTIPKEEAIDFYSLLNHKYLHYISDIIYKTTNANISKKFTLYFNFVSSKELLGIQRAVVTNILEKDSLTYKERLKLHALISKRKIFTNVFLHYTSKKIKDKYINGINTKACNKLVEIKDTLLDINKMDKFGIDSKYWFDLISIKIDFLHEIDIDITKQLMFDINQLRSNAEYKLISYSLLSALSIFLLLVLKFFTSKSVNKTLEDLDTKTEELNISLKSFDKHVITSHTDLKGVITFVSDAFCKISGYTKDELIDKPHNIIRHPDMKKKTFKKLWQDIGNNKMWIGEIKNKTKDNQFYWTRSIITIIYDKNNKKVGYSSISQNITNTKAMEELTITLEQKVQLRTEELEKEKYFINSILNSQKQLIVTTSGKDIKSINKAFMNFYDVESLGEFINKYNCICDTFNMRINKGSSEVKIDDRFWIQFILNNPTHSHKVLISRDNIEYIFSVTAININIDNEELVVSVFNDITQLENAKVEIERKVQEGLVEIKTLNDEIVDTQKEVIFTMGAIGETRSKETGNHVRRVAEYSKVLALKYGMKEEDAELLKQASPMHDIGKVGIPDNILNKPGKLTIEEFDKMKEHANIGYEMLKSSSKSIIKTAAIVAIQHHERYDGKGYPNNIKGEDIHIYGRITAVADVFDALGSNRCYKKAWDDAKIFALLKDERGKQFDPKIIDIFFENIDALLDIRDKYQDI